jgi:hypothetical protein
MPERGDRARQVELPHAEEARVVQCLDLALRRSGALIPMRQRLRIMEPQHLKIGEPEPGPLDRRSDLAQRRDMAAWEDVFRGPGIGSTRAFRRDRSCAAASRRHRSGDRSTAQGNVHRAAGRHTRTCRPRRSGQTAPRHRGSRAARTGRDLPPRHAPRLPRHQLLGAERDTEYIDIGDLMEIERQAAPAAADIEHALSRLEQQLGGDMPLLVSLCLLQAITSNSTPKASMCRPVRSMSPPKIPRASSVSISSRTARTHPRSGRPVFPISRRWIS